MQGYSDSDSDDEAEGEKKKGGNLLFKRSIGVFRVALGLPAISRPFLIGRGYRRSLLGVRSRLHIQVMFVLDKGIGGIFILVHTVLVLDVDLRAPAVRVAGVPPAEEGDVHGQSRSIGIPARSAMSRHSGSAGPREIVVRRPSSES